MIVNETAQATSVDLGTTAYLDLDQQAVVSPLQLSPLSGSVLVLKQ